MREFLLFRSFDQIILNILSFEKDLLHLKKDEKNHEKHKNVAKLYHQNETEIFLLIPGKNSYSLTPLDPKQIS